MSFLRAAYTTCVFVVIDNSMELAVLMAVIFLQHQTGRLGFLILHFECARDRFLHCRSLYTRKRISVIDEHFPTPKCMTLTCGELLEVALQTGPAGAKIRPVKPRFYVVGSLTLPAGMWVKLWFEAFGRSPCKQAWKPKDSIQVHIPIKWGM